MSTHDPHAQPYGDDRAGGPTPDHDPEGRALEEEITRGTLYDPEYGSSGRGSTAAVGHESTAGTADTTEAPEGIRTGTLVWGIIALLVALWSLATTVMDWSIDPVLVAIGLATLGGLVLVAGGLVGATRQKTR